MYTWSHCYLSNKKTSKLNHRAQPFVVGGIELEASRPKKRTDLSTTQSCVPLYLYRQIDLFAGRKLCNIEKNTKLDTFTRAGHTIVPMYTWNLLQEFHYKVCLIVNL